MNFVPAGAYRFCLALPAAFTQPGAQLLAELCIDIICACIPGPHNPDPGIPHGEVGDEAGCNFEAFVGKNPTLRIALKFDCEEDESIGKLDHVSGSQPSLNVVEMPPRPQSGHGWYSGAR